MAVIVRNMGGGGSVGIGGDASSGSGFDIFYVVENPVITLSQNSPTEAGIAWKVPYHEKDIYRFCIYKKEGSKPTSLSEMTYVKSYTCPTQTEGKSYTGNITGLVAGRTYWFVMTCVCVIDDEKIENASVKNAASIMLDSISDIFVCMDYNNAHFYSFMWYYYQSLGEYIYYMNKDSLAKKYAVPAELQSKFRFQFYKNGTVMVCYAIDGVDLRIYRRIAGTFALLRRITNLVEMKDPAYDLVDNDYVSNPVQWYHILSVRFDEAMSTMAITYSYLRKSTVSSGGVYSTYCFLMYNRVTCNTDFSSMIFSNTPIRLAMNNKVYNGAYDYVNDPRSISPNLSYVYVGASYGRNLNSSDLTNMGLNSVYEITSGWNYRQIFHTLITGGGAYGRFLSDDVIDLAIEGYHESSGGGVMTTSIGYAHKIFTNSEGDKTLTRLYPWSTTYGITNNTLIVGNVAVVVTKKRVEYNEGYGTIINVRTYLLNSINTTYPSPVDEVTFEGILYNFDYDYYVYTHISNPNANVLILRGIRKVDGVVQFAAYATPIVGGSDAICNSNGVINRNIYFGWRVANESTDEVNTRWGNITPWIDGDQTCGGIFGYLAYAYPPSYS